MTSSPTQQMFAPPPARTPGRNAPATAGFVLGMVGLLLGWIPFLGVLVTVPAIALSHAGRRRFRSGRAAHQDLSTAGVVAGWLGTGFCVLTSVLLIVSPPAVPPTQPVVEQPATAAAPAAPVLLAVPNVVGMTDAQARDTLQAAGFTNLLLGPATGPFPGVAAGTVTTQTPGPPASAAAGDAIVLGEAAAEPPLPAPVVLPQAVPTEQPAPTAEPFRPVVTVPDVDNDRPRVVAPRPAPRPLPLPRPAPPRAQSGPSGSSGGYANCTEARAAGVTPILRGQPGYAPKLDRDNDGIACE